MLKQIGLKAILAFLVWFVLITLASLLGLS